MPFNTNAGYGIGISFETVREICKDSKVMEGFTMQCGIERGGVNLVIKDERGREAEIKVRQWLQKIKLLR